MTDDVAILPMVPAGGPIEYVCAGADHVRVGRGRPDGTGHLTVHKDAWAYCSAGLPNTEHDWVHEAGVTLNRIRHQDMSATAEG